LTVKFNKKEPHHTLVRAIMLVDLVGYMY